MTFKFNIGGSRRSQREFRRDTGAGNIVFLMMSLVFVPIVLAHVAVMASSQIFSAGQIQLASLMSLIISAVN
jgi:hypothetical protein